MSTDASSRPTTALPAQLRTPVPPPRRPRHAGRARRGLGRPSTWALAVAVLLVGVVVALLLTDPAPLSARSAPTTAVAAVVATTAGDAALLT